MPHALRTKPPINLFAYTNLFMQHLYADPQIMDDNALEYVELNIWLPIAKAVLRQVTFVLTFQMVRWVTERGRFWSHGFI